MAKQDSKSASATLNALDDVAPLIRASLDALSFGFAVFDKDLKLVASNKAFQALRSYPSALCKPGTEIAELYRFNAERGDYGPGDIEDHVGSRLSRARQFQQHDLEYELATGRTLSIRYSPVAGEGLLLSYADITERKKAEQELARKEAQLRVALDNMPGGIMLGDRDLNHVLFNPQYCELYEFPDGLVKEGNSLRNDLLYQADRGDFGPGDNDELIEQVIANYQRREAESYERTIAGSGRTLQVYLGPTPEGGYVTIVTDITERKRAETALREYQHLMETILDHMPTPVFLRDLEGRFMLINRCYEDIHRVTKDGVRGRTLQEVFPMDVAEDFQTLDPEVINERRVLEREETHHLPDGQHILAAVKFPIFDSSDEVIAVGGVDVDITERKRVEEMLREQKRRAEEASALVAEKNQMLESLSNQLSKYLSPQVYASIFSGEQSVEIASKRKKLTIFFSDIANFTGTTDSLESEELTNLLNHYLTEMSKVALDHGATIDKYVGDAIIAFFGDPESRGAKADAIACVEMAIAMQRRMRELHSEWLDLGLERPFQIRIGINTGFCTVGNFGSGDRMDYTIIGNEVNLAARLEAHAEAGGILLAHETYALVKDTVFAEEQEALSVKGFAKPVRTYKVEGIYEDLKKDQSIIRREQDGVRLMVNLKKGKKRDVIKTIEDVLLELKS